MDATASGFETGGGGLSRRSTAALLYLVFADLAGFGMLLPDVQLRAERLGAPGWLIGAILSSTFVLQAIASPRWGALSDRIGRKPVVLACTAISASAMFLYSQASAVWIILASRVLAGFGAANVATAQATLAEGTPPAGRTGMMGYVGAAASTGLVLGPAIGGVLADSGGAFLVGLGAGALSLSGVALAWAWLPRGAPLHSTAPEPKGTLSLLRTHPLLPTLFAVATVGWFSLACLEGTFGRLLNHRFGAGALGFGMVFAYESLLSVLAQGFLAKPLSRRWGERRLLIGSFALQGMGLAAMPFAPTMASIFLAATAFGIGNGLLNPAINGWCSRVTPERRQGAMFGMLQSSRSLGFVVGPTLGGAMYDRNPAAPYLLAGAVSAFAIALLVARRPGITRAQ
ncbi:MAG TPA: MFS transporter [Fimbriimonas sp.]